MDETNKTDEEIVEETVEERSIADALDRLDALFERIEGIAERLDGIAEVSMAAAIDNGAEFNDSADSYIGTDDDSVIEIPEVEDMDLDI